MIEAVVTCVNYADFLAESLPHNRVLFDKMVVVTAPEDRATRRVCEYWNVECIPTDVFESRWSKFRKGCGINVGLAALQKKDWLIHVDADMVLPPLTRTFIELNELDPTFIYGIDRHICNDHDAWRAFLAMPQLQHESKTWVHLDKFPMGTRLCAEGKGWGYVPIGFFQLWNAASGNLAYPEDHDTAARTDAAFALKWPRAKRALLPEIVGYHLESEAAEKGANWNGRTTATFGATGIFAPPVATAKRPDCRKPEPDDPQEKY